MVAEANSNLTGDILVNMTVEALPYGIDTNRPISVGSLKPGEVYQDTQNNAPGNFFEDAFDNVFFNQPSDDIFYAFSLTEDATVFLSTCGSGIQDSYIHLLDGQGNHLESNDDSKGECGSSAADQRLSYMTQQLTAGDYFLVVEGYADNTGNITTTIEVEGQFIKTGSSFNNPILVGVIDGTGIYEDQQNNHPSNEFEDLYEGSRNQRSDDIFYQFVLENGMEVSINTCNSSFDTYLHLLDANGNEITRNDDTNFCSASFRSLIQRNLQAGTYYIVAEGYSSSSGDIVIQISGSSSSSSARIASSNDLEEVSHSANSKFEVYPNPTSDVINILLPENVSGTIEYQIIKNDGVVISSNSQTIKDGQHIYSIDVSGNPIGLYWIYLRTSDGVVQYFKIIKE